jgi:UrcA family protein
MLKQLIIASLAITSVVATSAQAQEARSVRISIAGIDTHSESGARVILQRVKFAARTVCGPVPSHLERYKQYEPCVRDVTQRTVAGLDNPLLTAMLTQDEVGAHQAKLASAN